MKKNTIQFKTKAGNEYELTRPTVDVRAEVNDMLAGAMASKNPDSKSFSIFLAFARATMPKSTAFDDMIDDDVAEIGQRAIQLSTLGK